MPRTAAEGQAGGSGGSAALDTSAQADDPSDSEHMQNSGEPLEQRDVLAGTQTASTLQALADAVAEPSAFLQPSAQIADVARQAAKVRGPRSVVGMCTSADL